MRALASGRDTTQVMGHLFSANMNSTSDQLIQVKSQTGMPWILRRIVATNATRAMNTVVGGFYTGGGKTGTILVANSQVYALLDDPTKWVDLTIAATPLNTVLSTNVIILSLTTPQGQAATCDFYIYGDLLDRP